MRLLVLFFLLVVSLFANAQKNKKSIPYRKLSLEQKEMFLLDKIRQAKEAKDYESKEDYELKLRNLRFFNRYSTKDILKNGFFVDAIQGVSFLSRSISTKGVATSSLAFTPSVCFGNTFYFSRTKKSALGLNLIYLRPIIFYTHPNYDNKVSYSIANVGITYLTLFKSRISGIDLSLNAGYTILSNVQFGNTWQGFDINPSINVRYQKLRFGIDFLSSFYFRKEINLRMNTLSFYFGAKF